MRIESTLSDFYNQEQGVPQGATLSTTLFYVKLNYIIKCLDYKTDGFLNIDAFCICFRSKNMRTIKRRLQQCLNRIEDWATRNGFKFAVQNSVRSLLSTSSLIRYVLFVDQAG